MRNLLSTRLRDLVSNPDQVCGAEARKTMLEAAEALERHLLNRLDDELKASLSETKESTMNEHCVHGNVPAYCSKCFDTSKPDGKDRPMNLSVVSATATPRVDADPFVRHFRHTGTEAKFIELARQLERELAEAKVALNQAASAIEHQESILSSTAPIIAENVPGPHARSLREWVVAEQAKADSYEDAARVVERLAEEYTHEHGSYDGSTNAWELGHRHMEKIEGWDDAIAAIRKRKGEKCQVTQATVSASKERSDG